ncbi:Hsp20/alpha crystallin family protein [Streptomyces chartreusis]
MGASGRRRGHRGRLPGGAGAARCGEGPDHRGGRRKRTGCPRRDQGKGTHRGGPQHSRRIGQFDYRTTLPPNADTEHVSADLTNGVLTVRVPKTGRGKPQRVEITG